MTDAAAWLIAAARNVLKKEIKKNKKIVTGRDVTLVTVAAAWHIAAACNIYD